MPVPRSPRTQREPQKSPSSPQKSISNVPETILCGPNSDQPILRFSPDFIGARVSSADHTSRKPGDASEEKPKRQYKMLRTDSKLVKAVFHGHGFEQTNIHDLNFDILWTGSHLRAYCLRSLSPNQRVNHFPRSFELTRKDRLYRNIERMQIRCGKQHFDFIPEFFVTPDEFEKLSKRVSSAGSLVSNSPKFPFIVKPVGSSRGRGIFVAVRPDQVPLGSLMLVSRYISDPCLIQGHKFDIRLYVAVTSIHPLVCYLYQDGMARLAVKKYNPHFRSFQDSCVHLTNYSVNKLNDKYVRNREGDSESSGHKWSLSGLLKHLREHHSADPTLLMVRIEDLIIKTLLSCQSPVGAACLTFVPYEGNCFEVFGFDILLDSALKPWLLEVNLSPSLSCDTPLDFRIKSGMVCDLLSLAGIPAYHRGDPRDKEDTDTPQSGKRESQNIGDSESMDTIPDTQKETLERPGVKLRRRNTRRSVASLKLARKNRIHMLKKQSLHQKGKMPPLSKNQSVSLLAEGHIQRVRDEEGRAGKFHRLFPQQHTWTLYSEYLEDLGAGRNFDEVLHNNLFPSRTGEESSGALETVVEKTQNFLESSGSVKSLDSVDGECRAFLAGPIKRSALYEAKMAHGKTKHGIFTKLKFHSMPSSTTPSTDKKTTASSQDQRKRNRTWTGGGGQDGGKGRKRLDTDLRDLVIDNPRDIQELIVPLPSPLQEGEELGGTDLVDREKFCE